MIILSDRKYDKPFNTCLIDWEGKIVFSSGKPVTSPYLVKKKFKEGVLAYRFRSETESYYLGFLFLR
jgi:hypothetical protein